MEDILLSDNFPLREFLRSDEADRLGIKNVPTVDDILNMHAVALLLQLVRDAAQERTGREHPIVITSGYRSGEVNRAVGGSTTSDHLTGLAVDVRSTYGDAWALARLILDLGLAFDQLIIYPNAQLHVGLGKRMRGQVLESLGGGRYRTVEL